MSLSLEIKKSFPTFDLEIAFEAGPETLGLLGESGSGKSLTMRCIAGLETPDEGRIVVNGTVFFDSAAKINLTPQARKTAMLFQSYMLFPNMTVAENIAAGLPRKTPKDQAKRIVEEQLNLFGLKGFGKRYPIRLSGGQQQRVALARMLTANPGVLMLDEPFSALDSHLKNVLEQDLHDLFDAFEGTILYVSHDIDEAFGFCNRIAVIDHGRLAQISVTEDIILRPASYATLKVSGVKNISPAHYLDDHTVSADMWGLTLKSQQTVPSDVAYLGFRATDIKRAGNEPDNAFEAEVTRVSDSRFKRAVILRVSGFDELIRWEIGRENTPLQDLPQRGDIVKVFIPPEEIALVTR